MSESLSDRLGRLKLVVYGPSVEDGQRVRLRCIDCERVGIGRYEEIVYDVPEGRYPALFFDKASDYRVAILLPFRIEVIGYHLLHSVRPEWNRAWIGDRPVGVQAIDVETRRFIFLEGPTPKR